MGEKRGAYRILEENAEGKRLVWRLRRRWEDNIKVDLQDVRGGRNWIDLAQNRDRWREFVNAVMNLRLIWNAWSFLTNWGPVNFSRRTLSPLSYLGSEIWCDTRTKQNSTDRFSAAFMLDFYQNSPAVSVYCLLYLGKFYFITTNYRK
jgi:hypothetical protein